MGMSIHLSDNWTHLRYATFGEMRRLLCAAAGLGDLNDYVGHGGQRQWTPAAKRDVLVCGLLRRDDVSDAIPRSQCGRLARRIRKLMPLVKAPTPEQGKVDQVELMQAFAAALERSARSKTGLGWN